MCQRFDTGSTYHRRQPSERENYYPCQALIIGVSHNVEWARIVSKGMNTCLRAYEPPDPTLHTTAVPAQDTSEHECQENKIRDNVERTRILAREPRAVRQTPPTQCPENVIMPDNVIQELHCSVSEEINTNYTGSKRHLRAIKWSQWR